MLCGSATPSPLPSAAQARHVPGMNCIGPTARSAIGSPSSTPPSVSLTLSVPFEPSSAMPRMVGVVDPSGASDVPAVGGVAGLDLADGADELPRQVAVRAAAGQDALGVPVGGEHGHRDPGGVGAGRLRDATAAGAGLRGVRRRRRGQRGQSREVVGCAAVDLCAGRRVVGRHGVRAAHRQTRGLGRGRVRPSRPRPPPVPAAPLRIRRPTPPPRAISPVTRQLVTPHLRRFCPARRPRPETPRPTQQHRTRRLNSGAGSTVRSSRGGSRRGEQCGAHDAVAGGRGMMHPCPPVITSRSADRWCGEPFGDAPRLNPGARDAVHTEPCGCCSSGTSSCPFGGGAGPGPAAGGRARRRARSRPMCRSSRTPCCPAATGWAGPRLGGRGDAGRPPAGGCPGRRVGRPFGAR